MSGAAVAFGLALTAGAAGAAENGVFADKIVFGQAAVLEGPAASLGLGMREGLNAAFGEVNRAGGVKGRKLELVARDDGYEPKKSIEVTRQLLEQDKVFALVGPVGTPTSAATQPIASEAGVPFIGAFTGAEFLRSQAARRQCPRLLFPGDRGDGRAPDQRSRHRAHRDLLPGRRLRPGWPRRRAAGPEGTYERNTIAVKRALLDIRRGKPEAIIMVGAYKPCATFIKLARDLRLDAIFVNISFVGSNALAKELGPDGAGVVVTQVVPFPDDTKLPLVARYHAALKASDPKAQPGFGSLEGYMVGRLVAAALERIDGEPTRKALLDIIVKTRDFDLGGAKLTYGPDDNRGLDEVFLTVIQPDGTFKPVSTLARAGG